MSVFRIIRWLIVTLSTFALRDICSASDVGSSDVKCIKSHYAIHHHSFINRPARARRLLLLGPAAATDTHTHTATRPTHTRAHFYWKLIALYSNYKSIIYLALMIYSFANAEQIQFTPSQCAFPACAAAAPDEVINGRTHSSTFPLRNVVNFIPRWAIRNGLRNRLP